MHHCLSRILPNNHESMQGLSFLVCTRNSAIANLRPGISRGSRELWQTEENACSYPGSFWCSTRLSQCVWAHHLMSLMDVTHEFIIPNS
mmetsp:Transcript_24042/g.51909  ORF Transcript_24042/g.51909 Transcript_24042/m.51909 type:complete len:89 (+) Transcript_24042:4116-4382(+)